MSKEEIFSNVCEVFKQVFNDNSPLTLESKSGDIKVWDSMGQVKFMAQLEKAFSVKFKMKDIVGLHTIGNIVDTIFEKL